ncbi:MAG: GIY-YIG nuclease family protein [Candidatus Colwellbacteria bacterium]|nr:GIY-YIG nuclease family protein [Candidatus Colwellbacteria bacterium]
MSGFVYILQGNKGKFYIGSTANINRRLKQHKAGYGRATNNIKATTLVFAQKLATISEARQLEKRLKKFKRKDYLEKIIKDGYLKIASK